MSAALYGDAALVKRLLALGADPDARDTAGATALMWAAPDRGKMQLLLDAGADVNARSDAGRSALVVVRRHRRSRGRR
jgi:ankyrin repeat protein